MIAARLLTEVTSRTENQLSSWLILSLRPANGRRRYKVTPSLIWLGTNQESALKLARIGQQGLFRVMFRLAVSW